MQKQRTDALLLCIIPVAALLFYSFYRGNSPFLSPDSPAYMYFGEDRPVGYPLFLALIKFLSGNFFAAVYIQLAVLCASLTLLVFALLKETRSRNLALALEMMLFANPGLLMLADNIMSDCLSAACVALFCACLLRMRSNAKYERVMLPAVTALALTIRTVNIALLPAAVIAILIHGKKRTSSLPMLLCAVAFAYALTPAVHYLRHDNITPSNPLARELFRKTLLHAWPENEKANACEGNLIAKDTKDAIMYMNAMPEDLRPLIYSPVTAYLRYRIIVPAIAAKYHAASYAEVDPILLCYTLARMQSDPLFFVNDAANRFWGLLTYSTFISPAAHDAVTAYLTAHPLALPPPVARHDNDYLMREQALKDTGLDASVFANVEDSIKPPQARPQPLVFALSAFQIVAALMMLIGIIFVSTSSLSLIGIAFYTQMILTAFADVAVPRYVFPLWPEMCLAVMLTFLTLRNRSLNP